MVPLKVVAVRWHWCRKERLKERMMMMKRDQTGNTRYQSYNSIMNRYMVRHSIKSSTRQCWRTGMIGRVQQYLTIDYDYVV
jgi:hypothetical protein